MNKTIHEYLKDLDWSTPAGIRQETIRQLQLIDEKDLPLLAQPLGKEHWDGAAEVLSQIGYPGIKSILPELLVWLQDLNWPGAGAVSRLLIDVGEPLIPELQRVMAGEPADEEWMYWIIHSILEHWPKELVARLQPELMNLACHSRSGFGAIVLLNKHELKPLAVLTALLDQKEQSTLSRMNQLMLEHADVDCAEFNRRFHEALYRTDDAKDLKAFMEENGTQQSYCSQIKHCREYLSELEETRKEIIGTIISKYDTGLSCSICYPFLAKLELTGQLFALTRQEDRRYG
ncbi:hypothetical protein C2I18_03025 [Paenibacillus sp. PK3_47]|uniref:DUF5071 domain-containing protein n=1 Tax=Paenibacillus sp. PK3_47 TaxID=2072642 RepID=UPI00201D7696|nr:DUF5071 domain-containing protein [Paenibacillus sp. PK3_47]UQZ32619.1 hypothetical protein C2I18_03025 [Paenibacillus sp. PK3_47]